MTVTETKLSPCPFCGKPPAYGGSGERQRGLMIECVTDGCVNPHISYYEHATAIEKWNTRALTATLSGQPDGWQDISTAPKDGSYVDLWFDKSEFDSGEPDDFVYERVPDCRWLGNERTPGWYAEHTENGPYYIGDGATHWMLRPKSPSLAGDGNG